VTGAGGFLGAHVEAGLRAEGWDVVGAGRPSISIPSESFTKLLRGTRPGVVVHCAGPASVPASLADPLADFSGSAGVLVALVGELAALEPAPRLVLLSSAAVYGEPSRLPVAEDAPLVPLSPYGLNRLACEVLLRDLGERFGVPTAILRVFSAYGERLRRQILWDIARQALDHGRVCLQGTGAESRDFVHATDVARAVRVVLDGGAFAGEPYNVATGRETTIAELAGLLLDALDSSAEVTFSGAPRQGDPSNWRADIDRIAGLGFVPTVAIEDGARRYAVWARTAA
jgi:UDP-glucose 4-epimerase